MHLSLLVKVFDFLIKPVNRETVEVLVSRLIEEFKYSKNYFLHLNKWISVRISDIIYIEKNINNSNVITSTKSYSTTKNLITLLNELPKNFRKCHRSFIVNEQKIISIDKKKGYVFLTNNFNCPINSYFEL